jgi:hypothetical protein
MKRSRTCILIAIFVVAIILRGFFLTRNIYLHPDFFHQDCAAIDKQFSSGNRPYVNDFGYEASNVAYSLVCRGDGLANPFGGETGPTGWVAPGMVLVYAAAFYMFGCFSFYAMLFLCITAVLLSLVLVYLVYLVSLHIFNRPGAACVCAALFAVCPHDIYLFTIRDMTEFNIMPVLFILVFYCLLRWRRRYDKASLVLFSLCSAVSILFNPVFTISILAGLILTACSARHIAVLKQSAAALVIIMLLVAPYVLYLRHQLGMWSFVKSNGPFELYQGNAPAAQGDLSRDYFYAHHPSKNAHAYLTYKRQGEADFIHTSFMLFCADFDPFRFISLTVNRFLFFYFIYPVSDSTLLIRYATYPLAGVSLILYLFQRLKNRSAYDLLLYVYIVTFSLPFMLTGIMWRYSLPVISLTTVMLGMSLVTFVDWFIARFKPFNGLRAFEQYFKS